ncbi:hypothetical protein SteCoe_16754 [Stentor coeruleus]|uniref:Uncharacterized protein n=1 Tax=Stentor coeruleus TaxID=5963 RepID=A0A1R2C0H8_9CILI|nr:hypothetical protein SteCoe_16754 [Stentor coeruleus]
MAKESRQISSKSNKIISKLQKSTDVNIYSVFNADIYRKYELAESQYKSIDKNLKDGSVTKRIENVIEFYVKRQKVPDPEMHQHLLQVERKIGEVAHLIKNTYNIDWLCITLIGFSLVAVYVWKIAKKAEKKHYL